jgi:hypothetical protein
VTSSYAAEKAKTELQEEKAAAAAVAKALGEVMLLKSQEKRAGS